MAQPEVSSLRKIKLALIPEFCQSNSYKMRSNVISDAFILGFLFVLCVIQYLLNYFLQPSAQSMHDSGL